MLAERQQLFPAPVGEEAGEANAHEAARQNMQQEPAQELLGGQRHLPLFALVSVVFPPEGDLAIGKIHDPVVGDGDAMRIASQVVENVFRSSEWPLGVNHPVLTKQRAEKSVEGLFLGQAFDTTGEGQFSLAKSPLQSGDELAAKDTAEHLYRQEERVARVNPALVV